MLRAGEGVRVNVVNAGRVGEGGWYLHIPLGGVGRVVSAHPERELPAPGSIPTSQCPTSGSAARARCRVTACEAQFGRKAWVRGLDVPLGVKCV